MEPWKTLSLCLRSSTGLTAGWGPVRPVKNIQTSRSVSRGERQTVTWTGVFLCSGETFYLPDRQRDDLCSKHQVDRLQQQRSAMCECVVVFSHSVLCSFPCWSAAVLQAGVWPVPSGYYTHISTLADVQENVMEYLHVLSRPMVINHDHDIIWTEAYMDTVVRWADQSELRRSI